MNTLGSRLPAARNVDFTSNALRVALSDGREIIVPLEWFPRLRDATPAQRQKWRLIGSGQGIHWPEIDEDISVDSLLAPEMTLPYREPAPTRPKSRPAGKSRKPSPVRRQKV